jgi:hypothetical protein
MPSPKPVQVQVQSEREQDDAFAVGASVQGLFRTLNNEIRRLADSFALDGQLRLVCECGDRDCCARLSVPRSEFDAVRAVPTRFLARADRVRWDDSIVAERTDYVVVDRGGCDPASARATGSPTTLAIAERATNGGSAAVSDEFPPQPPLPGFRCDRCGYGACRRIAPERCPMCGGSTWSFETRFRSDSDFPLRPDPSH